MKNSNRVVDGDDRVVVVVRDLCPTMFHPFMMVYVCNSSWAPDIIIIVNLLGGVEFV